ncbi:hypothetical protein QM806_41455, partial [Rhodococcus sp. IEGM 1351]|nr:hypothetical protein [Rhodococcus sp. IEGM 1351]
GYGLGRHGRIALVVADADEARGDELRDWLRTSDPLVAPTRPTWLSGGLGVATRPRGRCGVPGQSGASGA